MIRRGHTVMRTSEIRKIAFVGDYLPRKCGIATFTHDMYASLAGRFPDSDAAARARAHVRRLENQFAEKTYKTGIFYLRRKAWDSAIIYFKDVIANYQGTSRVPEALMRLVESYRAIGYAEEVKETCANLRRFYPTAAGVTKSCPADSSAAAAPS